MPPTINSPNFWWWYWKIYKHTYRLWIGLSSLKEKATYTQRTTKIKWRWRIFIFFIDLNKRQRKVSVREGIERIKKSNQPHWALKQSWICIIWISVLLCFLVDCMIEGFWRFLSFSVGASDDDNKDLS